MIVKVFLSILVTVTLSAAIPSTAGATHQCIDAIGRDVFAYMRARGRCLRWCEFSILNDQLPTSTQCVRPSDDARTERCLQKAEEYLGVKSRALTECSRSDFISVYGDTETCYDQNQNLAQLLQCMKDRVDRFTEKTTSLIYTPFRYPVCGDGEIAPGYESCEPNVYPNGCADGTICHPTGCYCVYPGCGNGILEPGEDCEPYAYPNGCSFEEYCRYGDCSCQDPGGSASRAFLDPAPDLLQ